MQFSNSNHHRIGLQNRTMLGVPGAITQNQQVEWLFACAARVAPQFRTLLLTGESGTGKEVLAKAIHALSPATGRFIVVRCGELKTVAFESELFGHVHGAFTGADGDKAGTCELADGGTLLLDSVGEIPIPMQVRLLDALQKQEVKRAGARCRRKINIRVIATTKKDLNTAVRRGEFFEGLYVRLSSVQMHVPALRDRDGDIPLLAQHFLNRWAARYGKNVITISPAAEDILKTYTWPGNIRELENVVGYGCLKAKGEKIELEDLPPFFAAIAEGARSTTPPLWMGSDEMHRQLRG